MELKKYIKERIVKNKLPLNVEEVHNICLELLKEDNDECHNKIFFKYVLNLVASYINEINPGYTELLGLLKVNKAKIGNIIYYRWLTEEDYYEWLHIRSEIYSKLNENQKRLLNFIELSTLDFLSDINSINKYILYKDKKRMLLNKSGYSCEQTNKTSFVKYLGAQYKQGYTFEVLD